MSEELEPCHDCDEDGICTMNCGPTTDNEFTKEDWETEQAFVNGLCEVMIRCGLSTGHGDKFNKVLAELEEQLSARPAPDAELVERLSDLHHRLGLALYSEQELLPLLCKEIQLALYEAIAALSTQPDQVAVSRSDLESQLRQEREKVAELNTIIADVYISHLTNEGGIVDGAILRRLAEFVNSGAAKAIRQEQQLLATTGQGGG